MILEVFDYFFKVAMHSLSLACWYIYIYESSLHGIIISIIHSIILYVVQLLVISSLHVFGDGFYLFVWCASILFHSLHITFSLFCISVCLYLHSCVVIFIHSSLPCDVAWVAPFPYIMITTWDHSQRIFQYICLLWSNMMMMQVCMFHVLQVWRINYSTLVLF